MSFCTATGRTRSSTKARTVSWISRCSSVSSKSTPRSLGSAREHVRKCRGACQRRPLSSPRRSPVARLAIRTGLVPLTDQSIEAGASQEMSIAERSATEPGVAPGVSFSLTDEQRALRELAHDFAEKEIRPKAAEYDVHMTHPADVIAKAHEVGLMNLHVPAEYGGPELCLLDGVLVARGALLGLLGHRHVARLQRAGRRPGDHRRHGRAEAHLASAAARGADPLLVRPQRARRRLGRRADQDDRDRARRRVRPQRLEDVHHQRRLLGLDGRLREDRPGRRATAACPRSSSRWTRPA